MKNPIKKIALILILIIILPALIFSLYEINSLNQSERVIGEIYNKQLDAILFSVNQYSEDVISGWRSRLNLILTEKLSHPASFLAKADSFLSINKSIRLIVFADSLKTKYSWEIFNNDSSVRDYKIRADNIKYFLKNNADIIKKLYTYERAGYIKITPLQKESTDSTTVFLFLLDDPANQKNICVMIIDPVEFIRGVLGAKLKETAEDKFIITCLPLSSESGNDFIYTTDNLNGQKIQQKKPLWLIPNYELGILLKGETTETLARQRSRTDLAVILLLVVILIIGVYIVFRNIRKEMELTRIKSDFVSNVSHELRTPLSLISMFAETLEMGRARTEEKKKEYYSIISKEAARLSRIVNKILSFSKMEAGKKEYRFSYIDLNHVVGDIFNSYQFHLQNNGFKFTFCPGTDIPEIKADGEAISEAVINLIDNAIKYSTVKKEITLTTGRDQSYAFIEISDKGIGISDENQKKIFEKFYRVSDGLVHNTKGTGLGLTLVKHIMDAHHGKIKVKSKLNEGSSFILNFPINN
jgi:two-component system phosphate regulon sensor histidine kinase PhoR